MTIISEDDDESVAIPGFCIAAPGPVSKIIQHNYKYSIDTKNSENNFVRFILDWMQTTKTRYSLFTTAAWLEPAELLTDTR